MCTIAAALQTWPGHALVVAANRDEALDRKASGPMLWDARPRILAPRDDQAGGTWLGLNADGVFSGITNRYRAPRDSSRRSRGELVLKALQCATAAEAHARLATLSARDYNAFHLFYADRTRAFVTWSDGERLSQEELGPGLHVITERSYGAADSLRTEDIRHAWPAKPARLHDQLKPLLTRHRRAAFFRATCIHVPLINYGTRSSLIFGLADRSEDSTLLWAEGAPCTHAYVEQRELVQRLFAKG